jgi:hypothetical protein
VAVHKYFEEYLFKKIPIFMTTVSNFTLNPAAIDFQEGRMNSYVANGDSIAELPIQRNGLISLNSADFVL